MKSIRALFIVIIICLSFVFNSCSDFFNFNKEFKWQTTDNDVLFWGVVKDPTYTYEWIGGNWNSFANGKGVLLTYNSDNDIIQRDSLEAYYGALRKKDVKKVSDGKYVGEFEKKKMQGFGVLVKSNEIFAGNFANSQPNGYLDWYVGGKLRYKGNWLNGSFDGEGTLYKENNETVTGVWKNGKIHEKMMEFSNEVGDYYGYIKDGKPSRRGILKYKDGSVYEGEWKDGKYEGEGVFYNEVDSVIGEWIAGKLDGYAWYYSPEFYFEGDFTQGLPNGFGAVLFADSSYYSGTFENGKKSGYGDLILPNNDSYFGDWVNDLQDGYGSYYFANGDSYVGQWKNGLQHGEGTYTSNEFTYIGNWEDGWINGEGRIDYKNGDYYEGNFVENQRYGVGAYHSATGNVYEGEFVDGLYNGLGTYYFNDGSIYEGEFEDGKIKGDGTFYCIIDKDTLAITAFWDGNNFPKDVSILFSGGEIFEGSIVNGKISSNGSWFTTEGAVDKTKIKDLNKKLKKASAALEKVSTTLFYIQMTARVVSYIPIPVVRNVASIVDKTLKPVVNTLLVADMALSIATDVIDTYVESENSEEFKNNIEKDLTMIVVSNLVSKSARKIGVPLSKSVAKKALKNSAIKITKSKPFKKVVTLAKDKTGKLTKKLSTSKLSTFAHRLTGKKSHQYVSSKQYRKAISRNPKMKEKLTLGKEANGGTLRANMELVGGKSMGKRNLREAKLSKMAGKQRSQAHHVVPGNSPKAKRGREILSCCGIDINDPRNGIMLPQQPNSIHKGSIHGRHMSSYDDLIVDRLENMLRKNKGKCSEKACEKELDAIKRDLYKGNIKLLKNHRVNKIRNSFKRRR